MQFPSFGSFPKDQIIQPVDSVENYSEEGELEPIQGLKRARKVKRNKISHKPTESDVLWGESSHREYYTDRQGQFKQISTQVHDAAVPLYKRFRSTLLGYNYWEISNGTSKTKQLVLGNNSFNSDSSFGFHRFTNYITNPIRVDLSTKSGTNEFDESRNFIRFEEEYDYIEEPVSETRSKEELEFQKKCIEMEKQIQHVISKLMFRILRMIRLGYLWSNCKRS